LMPARRAEGSSMYAVAVCHMGLIWMGVGCCDTVSRDGLHSYLCALRALVQTSASSSGSPHVVLQHNNRVEQKFGDSCLHILLDYPSAAAAALAGVAARQHLPSRPGCRILSG
jgi:hypothetical protein